MLNTILNLFRTTRNESKPDNSINFSDISKNEFLKDYDENSSFLDNFPDDIRASIKARIESIKDAINKRPDPHHGDQIYHLFAGLRDLYISLWLEETGYGDKLALKLKQLTYIDDYGDYNFEDWNNELHKFISDRIYKLDSYLRKQTPEKYTLYAKRLGFDYFLYFHPHDPDWPIQDTIEDLALSISLAIEPYTERLDVYSEQSFDEIDDPKEYEIAVSM